MEKIKVLLTLSAFEGHDLGLRIMARKCVDAGMEVVYTRFYRIEETVKTAMEEDVDAIGISSYIGTHLHIISELIRVMKENNLDIPVIIGGVIPDDDVPKLLEKGVKRVIVAGTPASESLTAIQEVARM
jgi:methylmalonyl-CoA mutase C-terminal domain/subunit